MSAGSVDLDDMNDKDVLSIGSPEGDKNAVYDGDKPVQPTNDKETEEERAKRLQVRKVSPVKKFFSSIRVVFIIVLFTFTWVSIALVGYLAISENRKLYERFDTLDMQERIQHGVRGTMAGVVALFTRSMMAATNLANMAFPTGVVPKPEEDPYGTVEQTMAIWLYAALQGFTEGPGLTEYEYLPYQLIMAWDENWNERMIYYRPCANKSDRSYCDLLPPEAIFAHVDPSDLSTANWTLVYKNDVPKFFRKIGDIMKKRPEGERRVCEEYLRCSGIADIPEEEGGPMMFNLFGLGNVTGDRKMMELYNMTYAFDFWHFAVASNAQLMTQIQANRTGLCVSLYSEGEKNLPQAEKEEFKIKREKGLIQNPSNISVDRYSFATKLIPDTGAVTLEQDYYSARGSGYVASDRSICDASFDHGDEDFVSKTTTYLSYTTFDMEKLAQDKDHTVMLRFEYHDPLTKDAYRVMNILVVCVSIVWVLTILGVFIYFDVQFLLPLDRMRKMRQDLIKTALAGLDDDGVKAKELFGDLTDDSALINANGDEITVMQTLQERVDALYSSVIQGRIEDLNRIRNNLRKQLAALRVMNIFMRRDDEALRVVLPGLMDPSEMARRFRRTTLTVRGQKGETWMDTLGDAKHTFRTLKAVLSNHIAAQYFKAFCTQRGRSSVNSFFFLMDVSWLHQVESGARDEHEDFLSAMFSDSVSPSPASMSPRSPHNGSRDDGMNLSSDLLPSPETSALDLSRGDQEVNRPHRSHFAKSRDAGSRSHSSASSDTPNNTPSPTPTPEKKEQEKADDKKTPKVPKLPIAGMKSGAGGSAGSSAPASPGRSNVPQFLTKNGEGIARFLHECYFGKKSLAQHDMRHAALLGCSQIPDYLTFRDKDKIVYSPVMYDNLVTAVTKKFTSEVLPQFLNSVSFQVMVLSLMITGYFDKKAGKNEPEQGEDTAEPVPEFKRDGILKEMWHAAKGEKKKKSSAEDDDSSSSSSSSDEEDDDDEEKKPEKKPKKGAEKKDEESDSSDGSDSE